MSIISLCWAIFFSEALGFAVMPGSQRRLVEMEPKGEREYTMQNGIITSSPLLEGVQPFELGEERRSRLLEEERDNENQGLLLSSFLEWSNLKDGNKENLALYHSSAELSKELRQIPNISVEKKRDSGIELEFARFTPDVVKGEGQKEKKLHRAFFVFGEHARELVSPESGLAFVKSLPQSGITDFEVLALLNANPSGRNQVMERGSFCLRTDPEGVDLNRNYDDHWIRSLRNDTETYSGAEPFSEPQSRILRDAVLDFKPDVYVSVHSGTLAMFAPYAYSQGANVTNYDTLAKVMTTIDTKIHAPFGSVAKTIGYNSPGSSLDWAYDKANVKNAFAFEIYAPPEKKESIENGYQQSMVREQRRTRYRKASFLSKLRQEKESEQLECLREFNPTSQLSFDNTLLTWTQIYQDLLREVKKEAF